MGVFCTEPIAAGSVIELCPVILIPADQARQIIRGYILYDYYFEWRREIIALALGYGSLYNHSDEPNATFEPDFASELIVFKAGKTIEPGEEIVVDYHEGRSDEQVWFDVR